MKINLFLIALLTIFISISFVSSSLEINSEIKESLKNEGEAKIIVTLKEDYKLDSYSTLSSDSLGKIEKIKENKDLIEINENIFSGEFNEEEIETIISEENVLGIEPVRQFHTFLSEVNGIVNSSEVWNLEIEDLNISGNSQTVCIIDTGVNFSHSDLIGKNATCNIDCTGVSCVEDCLVTDLNGHGTHVAGIIGASHNLRGVSNSSKIISLKVFPGSERSGATTTMILNAIDWCVDNSEEYNISVISMSLGTDTQYSTTSSCEDDFPSFTSSISSAFEKNISVVVASGNEGVYTGISSPACISKAIPVGDTYDSDVGGINWGVCIDSSTFLDKIVCHANRNSILKLLAPGALINSTSNTGGYVEYGGTSMATPVVSGAILLIKEVLNKTNQSMNPNEIEDLLNNTGKQIYDSETGLNFSRIDVYEAIMELDNIEPSVSLIEPENNHINISSNYEFICNSTDWQLSNVTFYLWNETSLYYNESLEVNDDKFNESSFLVSDIPLGTYYWNCEYMDDKSNIGFSSSNFTLTISGVRVSLYSPSNNTYTSNNESNFTCILESEEGKALLNVTFYLWNETSLVYNESLDISGQQNESLFNYTFENEGDYYWNCLTFNNNSDNSSSSSNYTINYDISEPYFNSSILVSVTSSSATINWNNSEEVNYTIYYGTDVNLTLNYSNSTYSNSHLATISSLSSSTTYYYNVTIIDRAGNSNASLQSSFTTSSATLSSSSSSRRSSSSSGGSSIFSPSIEELSKGYTKRISKGDKIYFNLSNNERHNLTINNMSENWTEFLIQSEPIKVNLSVGEVEKINLSSSEYYDLMIGLNSIEGSIANLTILSINEPIIKQRNLSEEELNANFTAFNDSKDFSYMGSLRYYILGLIILVFVVIAIFIALIIDNSKLKKEKKPVKTIKEYGK